MRGRLYGQTSDTFALAPLAVGHSVREAPPEPSAETATELSPRECCASMPPAPVALVVTEEGALGDAGVGDGTLVAGAGAVAAGDDADPAVDPAVDAARGDS